MAETNENIQDLVEQITCKMLLNDAEFNYLDNKDENQKAKRKKIHDEKKEEINEVIKALCSVVEKQLPPGIAAPAGLNVLIARRMLFEMKDGKDATKEFAKVDPITLLSEYNIPVQNIEDIEHENYVQRDVYSNELFENFENKDFMMIQPEDSRLAFISHEAMVEAITIESNKQDFMKMIDQINDGTMTVEQLAESLDKQKDSNDTVIDSLMESMVCKMHGIKDPKDRLELLKVITSRRQEPDSKFRPDNYTYRTDMELIGQILELKEKNPNSPEIDQMLEEMRAVNKTAVEFMERNPNLLNELRAQFGENFHITELGNDSEPRSVEDMEKFIFEYEKSKARDVKEHDNTLPGLEEQEEIKQPEVEQERPEPERDKTQLTMAEKMENVKKNIIDIAKAKGATAALKFANNLIMNRSGEEREAITASVIEVVSRDEFIETAKEDDLGTIREIIGGCLDEDNKKQNPQLIDYVQALGGVSKDIKSRIKAQEMTVEEDTKSIGAQQPSRDDDEPEL